MSLCPQLCVLRSPNTQTEEVGLSFMPEKEKIQINDYKKNIFKIDVSFYSFSPINICFTEN